MGHTIPRGTHCMGSGAAGRRGVGGEGAAAGMRGAGENVLLLLAVLLQIVPLRCVCCF